MPQLIVGNKPVLEITGYTLYPGYSGHQSIWEAGSSTATYITSATTSGRLMASGQPLDTEFFKLDATSTRRQDFCIQDELYIYLLEDAFLRTVEHNYSNSPARYYVTCEVVYAGLSLRQYVPKEEVPLPVKTKVKLPKKVSTKAGRSLVIFKGMR